MLQLFYNEEHIPMKQGIKEKRLEARKQAAVNAWKEKQEKDAYEIEKEKK